jgi:hypothetical protein
MKQFLTIFSPQFGATLISTLILALTAAPGLAGENYSPYVDESFARNVYWGDTHLHSALSSDAFGLGVTLGPDQAFRFAAGQTVTSTWGIEARLGRPLDFVVLADHAESLGMMNLVKDGDPRVLGDAEIRRWHELLNGSVAERKTFSQEFFQRKTRQTAFRKLNQAASPELGFSIWEDALTAAEQHNVPYHFTTLLGFEWTSAPGGSNLHRVVIFRDNSDRAGQVLPLSSRGNAQPDELWDYLEDYEGKTGGQVLAIPHNGNLSNGLMFPTAERYGGGDVDNAYARRRARWEPVVEVTQIKGDGEAHPLLSPDDEFADYETWDSGNFEGAPKSPDMLQFEYARSGLRNGLVLQEKFGVNPYAFGMIGSTDAHTSLAAVEENNFFGKHSGVEPGAERWIHLVGKAGERAVKGWEQASSGYAAVWARENTRQALWDAIKRREVYATTGSRIGVRFFGGWSFEPADASVPDIAQRGYAGGVPMGATLAVGEGTPRFLVAASKDPMGANLDRIQIVKGWLDSRGESHEKVYEVSWSGARKLDSQGKLPDVGSTVDVAAATWYNKIGAVQLATVWRDPDFDAGERAFYYARVIEIPTPRWTAYDAKRYGVAMDEAVPMVTQERAYTSPIWYTP